MSDALEQEYPRGYELLEPLGQGGFGTVFRARQQSTGQAVAVKMLRLNDIEAPERRRTFERFERETRLCADLNHPNIVRLLDKGRIGDRYLYSVFEYVPGETLKDLLLREGPLPAPKAGDLMGQVLEGLASAHERGIVHRDLKPSNIMITSVGNRPHVKILDYGIGTLVPDARQTDFQTLTLTRETVGTPSYSAPEQLRGDPPTVKSDLYAWGLVFVECLTGRPVMRGATLAEIFHRQLSPGDVPLPPAILGHPLADLLRRVLQKNHRDRTGRTDHLYADFQKLNLNSIVGELRHTSPEAAAEPTEVVSPWPLMQIERRQITVLCCGVGMMPVGDMPEAEYEALDALERDLLSLCADAGARYGGYAAGTLGDSMMLFFGYPQAGDRDARHAARTALEIASQMRRRNVLLTERQRVRIEFRMGIHSGLVTICEGCPPSGITPNTALRLQNLAQPGTVLASDSARRLLDRYIEFEPFGAYALDRPTPAPVFLLTGERQTESFASLTGGPADQPMVGRTAELAALRALWEGGAGDRPRTVLLRGEPGIGKSRLAYEMRRLVTDGGAAALVCRCLPEHRNNGLSPVLDMLRDRLHLHEAAAGEEACRLETALAACDCPVEWSLPIVCSWLYMPIPEAYPPVPHSPERQKQILFEVLEQLLLRPNGHDPLLVVEDLHWADQVTLELLERLMRRIGGTRALLLLTARPEFTAPWESGAFTLMELNRISPEDTETMIRKLTGDRPVHPSVLDAVYERTDGVPLFIEELVRLMLDRRQMVEQPGGYRINGPFDAASVPITLQDLLNEKLGRLGTARETAQTAAVIGREFDYGLLASAALRDEASIQGDLDQMIFSGVIFRQRRVQGDSYIFRHALLRDAAYNGMVLSARSQIHGRIAVALENAFPEQAKADSAGIAHHFAEAGIFEKAVSYGTRAAARALERSLNDEAMVHANRVLVWIERLDPDRQAEAELGINGLLTQALMGKCGWTAPEVKARIERSRTLIDRMERQAYLFPALWALGTYHHVARNRDEAHAIIERLDEIARQSGDAGLQAATQTLKGQAHYIEGNYPAAARTLRQALELYDPKRHRDHALIFSLDTRVWALAALGNVCMFMGDALQARECGEQAVAWARSLNHIPSLGIALLYRGMVCHFADDREGTAAVCGELIAESRQYGLPAYEGYGAVMYSWAVGDAPTLRHILTMLRTMGCMLGLTQYDSLMADIEAAAGRLDEAVHCIDNCLALCREISEHYYEPELYRRRAQYLLQMYPEGNPEIRASLLKAVESARRQGMCRTEAMALRTLIRTGGDGAEPQARLDSLVSGHPDLSALLASD